MVSSAAPDRKLNKASTSTNWHYCSQPHPGPLCADNNQTEVAPGQKHCGVRAVPSRQCKILYNHLNKTIERLGQQYITLDTLELGDCFYQVGVDSYLMLPAAMYLRRITGDQATTSPGDY